ncbi:hypothetical protein [Ramlibacter pinisoli]|nr:hypothetical protein [Ramlibacter pinisoli]
MEEDRAHGSLLEILSHAPARPLAALSALAAFDDRRMLPFAL